MKRTQIYLPEPLYETYRLRAKLRGAPTAELIREALERDNATIAVDSGASQESWGTVAERLNITGGPKDLSRRIDDYLYGDK